MPTVRLLGKARHLVQLPQPRQVGGDEEWLEDFSSPSTTEGRRQRGTEWKQIVVPRHSDRNHPARCGTEDVNLGA